jgi:hypothetical protein
MPLDVAANARGCLMWLLPSQRCIQGRTQIAPGYFLPIAWPRIVELPVVCKFQICMTTWLLHCVGRSVLNVTDSNKMPFSQRI